MNVYTQSFDTAKANMAFDEWMLNQVQTQKKPLLRVYTWKNPGITYPNRVSLPIDLSSFDYAQRLSGGGIVFHAPNDIVFSIATQPIKHSKTPLKLFLNNISQAVSLTLYELGVKLVSDSTNQKNSISDFCANYPSTFEWKTGGEKRLGMALKKQKNGLLIQGSLNIHSSLPWFNAIKSQYSEYFVSPLNIAAPECAALLLARLQHLLGVE